jgi:hypothetical protein
LGSVLPVVGIAALMVFGLVVLLTALTYDPPVRSDKPNKRASARERRLAWDRWRRHAHQSLSERRLAWEQWRTHAHQSLSARRSAVQELAVALGTRALALAKEWWPRVRHRATDAQGRWLTAESITGQVIAVAVVSLVAAYLIVVAV